MRIRIVNLALIAALSWSCDGSDGIAEKVCPKATCGDYLTQQAAQNRYDSNQACYKDLDPDGDGIACPDLPSSGTGSGNGTGTGTGCPTTSACGCSGKKKDDCGGQCCKWTAGSGCGCK